MAHDEAETRRWGVAGAAFAANFIGFGVLFSFGAFLTPLARSFDTSTGPVGALYSALICAYYAGGAVGGRIGDRYGARPVVAVAALAMAGGLALTAVATSLWQAFATLGVLVGLAIGFCYPSMIGLIGRTFAGRRRAAALGILLAGVGAGTLVMPWVAYQLITAFGWRSTYLIFAVAALTTIGWAATRCDRTRGTRPELMPIGALARSRRSALFYAAVVALGPGFYAPVAFFNDYAVSKGVAAALAAGLVSISGATSVAARLVLGALGGRGSALWHIRFGFAGITAALVGWWASDGNVVLLVASAMSHGIGWALWVTATPLLLAEWYGVANLGGVTGIYYTGLGVGGLVGPAVCGFVIDAAGFEPAIALVMLTSVVALALLAVPVRAEPQTLPEAGTRHNHP